MKKSKVLAAMIMAALLFAFTGCSGSTGNPGGEDIKGGETSGKATIGSKGGSVNAGDNVKINIPAGALNDNTEITIKYYDSDDVTAAFLGGIEFGPDGTVFNNPVEVIMKLVDKPQNEKVSIFCYDEEYEMWYFVTEAECTDKTAKFELNHFSKYKIVDTQYKKYERFETEVRNGKANGLSDAQIFDNYVDYLLNHEHLMDKCIKAGGYWFKPCGLHAFGNYIFNNQEGDPESLHREIGKTNEVKKDVTGLINVGSGYTSNSEFIKNLYKTVDRQDAFHILVEVYYVMIEPTIELTASPSTSVRAGEKTMVWVSCYYEDLIMSDYDLTIPGEFKHFSIDKNKIKTDSLGMASFLATGLSKGTDTIEVRFRVDDQVFTGIPGGAYSYGLIKLSCDMPIEISGRIVQNSTYTFEKGPCKSLIGTEQEGVVDATIEYNFKGNFYVDGQSGMILEGEITLSGFNVSATSQPIIYRRDEGQGYSGTIKEKLWASVALDDSYENKKLYFGGNIKDGIIHSTVIGEDIPLKTKYEWEYNGTLIDGHMEDSYSKEPWLDCISIGNLFDFELKEGTSTKNYNEIKDKTIFDVSYEDGDAEFVGIFNTLNNYDGTYIIKNRTARVSQTVTIKMAGSEEE